MLLGKLNQIRKEHPALQQLRDCISTTPRMPTRSSIRSGATMS